MPRPHSPRIALRSRLSTIACCGLLAAATTAAAQDVLVVTPESYVPALTDWIASRTARGMKVAVRQPGEDVGATVREVAAASDGRLRFVMLVGDVDTVPCEYRPADAIAEFERDPRIATDAPLADLDGDDVPDLALGRVTADSPEEARAILARGLAYEASERGTWSRRLNIVGGVGGFGPQQDFALEMLMRTFLKRDVPDGIEVTMTYAKPSSPYCPPPAKFAQTFLERLNEGALVVAYVGHGSERNVDTLTFGDTRYPIMDLRHMPAVDIGVGAPLMIFVACSTGHLDGDNDCLSEELLRRPNGPLAVIASSRVSTPYSNGVLAKEVLDTMWSAPDGEPLTVGEVLLRAKRDMIDDQPDDAGRTQIEGFAEQFYVADASRRAVDRKEHIYLYHLFGDPTLVLARPRTLTIQGPGSVRAGAEVTVTGTTPFGGRALLQLVKQRDVAPSDSDAKVTDADFERDYTEANARVVETRELVVEAGEFSLELPIGAEVERGRYYVRVFIAGGTESAMAGLSIRVRPAAK